MKHQDVRPLEATGPWGGMKSPPNIQKAHARRFSAGSRISTLAEAAGEVEAGRWLMVHGRPQHPAFSMNQTLGTLRAFVRGGHVFRAIDHLIKSDPTPKEAKHGNDSTCEE